ncbi:kinase-like domain-containing protein [Scleroderma citrinum]
MDPRIRLEKVSKDSSKQNINLNDQVDRNLACSPLRGSRALVYRGTMRSTGKKVAIKVFRFGPPSEDKSTKRVLNEVATWSRLRHRNIVQVSGIATTFDYTISLITEWVDMGSAINYVQNREVDPRPLLVDVANGLSYLHGQQPPIIHGDLRGKNIMITQDGRALVADYGISTLLNDDFVSTTSDSSHDPNWIRWMSPETMENYRDTTTADDVWAFGMTVVELLTRKPPFHDIPSIDRVMTRIVQGPLDRPSHGVTNGRLTDAWWDICCLCWNSVPSQRPSMAQILGRLE